MPKFKSGNLRKLSLITLLNLVIICGYAQTTSTKSQELMFAIWADARGSSLINHSSTVEMVNTVKDVQFNAVLLQVRQNGDAYYISTREPLASAIEPDYIDPLGDAITLFHANKNEGKIQVHPWFTLLRAFTANVYPTPPSGNVMVSHPEWLNEDVSGNKMDADKSYFLDPGIPSVQNHLINVVTEVVQSYNVDGVHLGSIRYPQRGLSWGYNPTTVAIFNSDKNKSGKPLPDDPEWCQWRRDKLTDLVRNIYKAVKEIKPEVIVSVGAETMGDPPQSVEEFRGSAIYKEHFQDWVSWAEEGIVDVIFLKSFYSYPRANEEFEGWVNFALANKGNARVCVGVSGEVNFTNQIVEQLQFVRSQSVSDGIALWSYTKPTKDDPELLFKVLRTSMFGGEYLKVKKPRLPKYEPPVPLMVEERLTTPGLAVEVIETTPTITIPTVEEEIITSPLTEILIPEEIETITATAIEMPEEPEITPVPTPSPTPMIRIPPPPEKKWDTIYLKNGNSFEGSVVDEIDGKAIIQTPSGLKMIIPVGNIEKVVRIIK